MSKIGRNAPCPCRSGKKYKRCCLGADASRLQARALAPTIATIPRPPVPVEPHLDLVPSVLFNGHRFRAIWSTLHYRPETETFHEFLVHVVKLTFGEAWWKIQVGMAPDKQHAVVRWAFELCEVIKADREGKEEPDGIAIDTDATGPTWALLQLGYDLFCLQAKNKLPAFIVDRLRRRQDFQSARYEVAVASIMVRAGLEIEYLDDKEILEKHCEFIATDRRSGVRIGVEAKSRRRRGVFHEPGTFSYSEDARGIENLLRKAQKQKPEGLPFLIFVDTNLPPSDGLPNDEKPLLRDLKGMVDRIGGSKPDSPDPFAALFVTNFPHHYGWPDGKSYKGEWVMTLPRYSQDRVPPLLLNRIYETTGRYDTIPVEV